MDKKILLSIILFISIFMKEASTNAETNVIRIGVDNANVRSEPSMTASVIGSANRNEQFHVLKEQYDWYQVQLSGGKKGWIAGHIVTEDAPSMSTSASQTGIITADRVNVRNDPSLSASIIGTAYSGDQVGIISRENGWVNIRFQNETAWVSSQFVRTKSASSKSSKTNYVYIKNDGTNIRTSPSTSSSVIVQGSQGERYPVIGQEGDWYKISLASGNEAYVASWVVSSTNLVNPSSGNSGGLNGKVIVLDPGHGGKDGGTTGKQGTVEKDVTLQTAERLANKLQQKGATVILTRSSDQYIPLPSRTNQAHHYNADAFISIHYDGTSESSARGFTTYYYHHYQKQLANSINNGLDHSLSSKNRGTRNGDYFVIRENSQPAILVELGYLTNPYEESSIVTESYQNIVTTAISNGLQTYFSK
ncbi:N-acetylmuramoyl-L-alanine amidase [Domibacillus epiphyticus]|uniref:SH3b domain-containing protein n=1 Tax=Domibacillus epiphyticus TaxID=1714355 RepID=A0A1V2AAS4_9BACI|nr:N-acetylmuramoyl-L-alanine amidase [Domibacillus epiphyticus]OMP68106.1 hypothetical protein BTO28_03910 [Domibacillus epiphyticus]